MDIGWGELLVIGIVALIVIGPKDLPRLFNTLGRFTAKARAMGREFQRAMDEAARESGVKEASADMKAMMSKKNLGLDGIEAAARKFESWDPLKKEAARPPAPPPGSETAKLAEARAAGAAERHAAATAAKAGTTTGPAASAAPAPAAPVPTARPASTASASPGPARAPRAETAGKAAAKAAAPRAPRQRAPKKPT
jgi:sec-independent protein translocase protein TatB